MLHHRLRRVDTQTLGRARSEIIAAIRLHDRRALRSGRIDEAGRPSDRRGALGRGGTILAGAERFFMEFIRLNSKYIFIFSGAQVISIIMIISGTYFLMNPFNGHVQETES